MTITTSGLLSQSKKIQDADDLVAPTSRTKLPAWLRAELDSGRQNLIALSGEQVAAEGARRTDSTAVIAAFEEGEKLIRSTSTYLNALEPSAARPAQRAFYGLGPKLPVSFRHSDIDDYLLGFQKAQTLEGVIADAKLRPGTLERIAAVLGVLDAQSEGAQIGDRADLSGDKKIAADALEESISRVRYALWMSLPGMFKDPLLHNYGFVPRQESETERSAAPTKTAA